MPLPHFQRVGSRLVNRTDHVWYRRNGVYRCCLCGASTRELPPDSPTPEEWMPKRYERLTDVERALCPKVE